MVNVTIDYCSSCLDEGTLTHLWLVYRGPVIATFCPYCDGQS